MKTKWCPLVAWLVITTVVAGSALYYLYFFPPKYLESWFSHAGLIAMIGWVFLIFGPRRWSSLSAFPAYVFPAVLSLGYAILVLRYFSTAEGSFRTLADVALLFSDDHALLAGWVHYLAFDLFIGAWIARRADDAGISRIVQAPLLVSTFMFGPLGLLLFFIFWKSRDLVLDTRKLMAQGAG